MAIKIPQTTIRRITKQKKVITIFHDWEGGENGIEIQGGMPALKEWMRSQLARLDHQILVALQIADVLDDDPDLSDASLLKDKTVIVDLLSKRQRT